MLRVATLQNRLTGQWSYLKYVLSKYSIFIVDVKLMPVRVCRVQCLQLQRFFIHSPPWPSGYKRRIPTLVSMVRARFEPRCGRSHFAPTRNGVRVCGRNRTEARKREWAEGTVSSLPGTLNSRIKLCHSTGVARSGGGVRTSTTSYA